MIKVYQDGNRFIIQFPELNLTIESFSTFSQSMHKRARSRLLFLHPYCVKVVGATYSFDSTYSFNISVREMIGWLGRISTNMVYSIQDLKYSEIIRKHLIDGKDLV